MKKKILLIVFFICFCIEGNSQITLSHNIGNTLIKKDMASCDKEEVWARAFILSEFGISTNEQFLLTSGQIAVSNSYNGAKINFSIYSIDENFPNSQPTPLGQSYFVSTPLIGDTPEIVQIDFPLPIVIPSGVQKILVTATQLDDIYNPDYKKVSIAGTAQDNDLSWFKNCNTYGSYVSTDKLNPSYPDANFFINVTGKKRSIINSNTNTYLSHNIGDNTVETKMFSCSTGFHYWARKFKLADFGITKSKELIITDGSLALAGVGWLANFQFNIYKIDANFPSSFDKKELIGSSQVFKVNPFSQYAQKSRIYTIKFDNPVVVPADVEMILVEVHKGIEYGDGLAYIGGTEQSNDASWYRGCNGHASGEYKTTDDLADSGIGYWTKGLNYYITVNGDAKTILPFEIVNNTNCSGESSSFNLTNTTNIKSVVWNFDDTSSGANNTSNIINPSHIFSNAGKYHITANVEHIDGKKYLIEDDIEIFQTPIINSNVTLKQCDDDTDGFSLFNLTEVNSKIVSNPSDFTINYFENKADAESNNSPITNTIAYRNKTASSQKIWAIVESNKGCYSISEVDLIITTTQIPSNYKKEYFVCDNGTDTSDGIATFDFSSATTDIKNIFPANQQLNISYYKSISEALSESNPITNITNYQNTDSPNQQIIYTRVDSAIDNECLGLGPHIVLNVDTIPTANPVILAPQCDDDRDGLYHFDTSNIQSTIIGSQSNVAVIYVDKNGNTLPSPLPNPFISSSQKITARITNSLSQDPAGKCYDETTIDFVVNTVPLANNITPQIACDTDFDGMYSFDTSSIQNTIVGNQTNIKVSYYDEKGNTLSSPLPNPFITSSTDITVRLENLIQGSCFDETTVSFLVREKPYFELKESDIICMNESPMLAISVENPNGNYSYHWTDENDNTVSNSINFTATKGGLYSVVATNSYGCLSDKKEIIIIESEKAIINNSDITVIEDSENNSIQINTENLGSGDYEFRLKDYNDVVLIDYQSDSYFENLIGGIYKIEINDRNGCGVVSRDVSILSFPKFFTPNNDGENDTWQLRGISKKYYTEGRINIFNRFGKTLVEFSIFDFGWDGMYLGKQLPSNDYWFSIKLIDTKGVLRTRKGSFSLIRR